MRCRLLACGGIMLRSNSKKYRRTKSNSLSKDINWLGVSRPSARRIIVKPQSEVKAAARCSTPSRNCGFCQNQPSPHPA
jgi:hypothetical protein